MDIEPKAELSDKEIIFAETYLVCLNKAESARKSGTPKKSAREQGYAIYNRPHVKSYIEERLRERVLSAEETVKLISDTAQSSLTDYYVPVKVVKRDQIETPLAEVIRQKNEYIIREELYCERLGLTGEEFDKFQEGLNMERSQILRLEIELERNPKAFRIMETEARLVEEMQLDINLLVADKEKGKVKKIKYGQSGLEVEMYSALDAQEKLMRMHGKYEKDNMQKPEAPGPIKVEIVRPKADD